MSLLGFLHHPALRAAPSRGRVFERPRPRRVTGVHHCWVCGAEVTQPYWLVPGREDLRHAVWWGHCDTRWFESPEAVREQGREAA